MDQGLATGRGLALALRERALAALEVSTTMLTVAQNLLRQGNLREAARLRGEARYKRNESILLMDQARKVEKGSSNLLGFPNRRTAEADTTQAENSEERSPLLRTGRRNSRTG
jgi:hypothetical protein